MVHQHFMLVPILTVAENIMLGDRAAALGVLLDYDAARKRVRELSERYGLPSIPTRARPASGRPAAAGGDPEGALPRRRVLILDEPTAVLTPQEAEELFASSGALKAQGKSIVFITHKLDEVLDIADRITVLRRGSVVDTVPAEARRRRGSRA